MADRIVRFPGKTTAEHTPDYILEAAKGRDLQTVVVVGMNKDGGLWFSGSTSNIEHVALLLDRAKQRLLDNIKNYDPAR